MKTVPVAGSGFRPYEVLIGRQLLARAGQLIKPMLNRDRVAVVADETVRDLHAGVLLASLADVGVAADIVTVPPGEASKSFAELERLCDRLLALGLDRKDAIVALGGGVVGDLTGFAAAIYMRGVDFVQVPTTLLAQVDSSVGGKTAIDTPRGKNMIGAFWQPRLVVADLDVLDTLPEREMRAGYAEVVKTALIGDAELFTRLETLGGQIFSGDPDALLQAVARSVEMKAAIVAEDAREADRRMLLNLGHTFGHAIEAETGFGETLNHGEAVAMGCALAFRFSVALGLCAHEDAERVEQTLRAVALPTRLAEAGRPLAADALLRHMAQDKKAESGRAVLILARGVGHAFVAREVDGTRLRRFLIEEGATA